MNLGKCHGQLFDPVVVPRGRDKIGRESLAAGEGPASRFEVLVVLLLGFDKVRI